MKKALITGVSGQDGSYMAELLLSKGYQVFGTIRVGGNKGYTPLGVNVLEVDFLDQSSIKEAIGVSNPDEVYNFAGISDLKTAYEHPDLTLKINHIAVDILLKESLCVNSKVRFLQASSSEVFSPSEIPINENFPRDMYTKNPYARAKLLTDIDVIQHNRDSKGTFSCSAFLFNHDSIRRDKGVLKKIAKALVDIKHGKDEVLKVGNLDAKRDWGAAEDYVGAMWRMLQQDRPEDLVLASGELHSVRDFINKACQILGFDIVWQGEGLNEFATDGQGKKIIEVVGEFYRPQAGYPKVGDISKAKSHIYWEPSRSFDELTTVMIGSML
jgi:GDPmannose 4,6-dehydratase